MKKIWRKMQNKTRNNSELIKYGSVNLPHTLLRRSINPREKRIFCTCSCHFSSRKETLQLFFAQDLFSFEPVLHFV